MCVLPSLSLLLLLPFADPNPCSGPSSTSSSTSRTTPISKRTRTASARTSRRSSSGSSTRNGDPSRPCVPFPLLVLLPAQAQLELTSLGSCCLVRAVLWGTWGSRTPKLVLLSFETGPPPPPPPPFLLHHQPSKSALPAPQPRTTPSMRPSLRLRGEIEKARVRNGTTCASLIGS